MVTGQFDSQTRLLAVNTNTTVEKQFAMQGLYKMMTELQLLADLSMDSILGEGGFAAVMRGYWRSSTPVAVKVFVTAAPTSDGPEGAGQLPIRAVAEALLARDLSHPNIIRTFDVRCCQLTRAFMCALLGKSASLPHWLDQEVQDEQTQLAVAEVSDAMTMYHGKTPLWSEEEPERDSGPDTSEHAGGDDMSADGFGGGRLSSTHRPISWEQLLNRMGAKPLDFLTVIVMQHATCGTLSSAVKSGIFVRKPSAPLSDSRRRLRGLLRTLKEMAMGLEHLHECNVVHGDIKPANVLLQDSRSDSRGFQAMLTDFGLARLVIEAKHYSKQASGTTNYMAPELFRDGEVSRATDVYSFGICIWELVHGQSAYKDVSQNRVMVNVLHGERPAWRAPTDGHMGDLQRTYMKCVRAQSDARPTAAELVTELGALEDAARAESQRESLHISRAASMATRPSYEVAMSH
ncbi:hypothetical protein QJQ45_018582 [Haematococcus lacustris]|nr:hypothetical protein QJQ45_018582 [Haematococcus lacustris]